MARWCCERALRCVRGYLPAYDPRSASQSRSSTKALLGSLKGTSRGWSPADLLEELRQPEGLDCAKEKGEGGWQCCGRSVSMNIQSI